MAELVALRLVAGVLLLLANGFFVTTEFALTRVRQFSEQEFTGSRGLERAWNMTERLEIYLSGCQVGITVMSVGLGVVAEPALAAVVDPLLKSLGLVASSGGHAAISVIISLAIINLMHVIIGEQAPTYLGVERAKLVAEYGSAPLYYWTKLMSPVIIVADRIAKGLLGLFGVSIERSWSEEELEEGHEKPSSRAELRQQMGESLSSMGLTRERTQEVINALEIGTTPVSEVMTLREDVVALSTEDSFAESLERIEEHPHVRFPLVGTSLDDPQGIVYTPALLRDVDALRDGEHTLTDVAAPPMTVEADTPISDVIDQLQEQSQELAFVLEGGNSVGIVTATDAFEAITGELEDPLDDAA
jgi:CBS domain containing-hemolysin-like protein